MVPRSTKVEDLQGKTYNVQVEVLGMEETWNTPSLVCASTLIGGKAIFSQVTI